MYIPTPRELGIEGEGMYLVGYNGAVVYKLDKDGHIVETLFETIMTQNQVNKVLNIANDLAVEMDIGDKLYAKVPNKEEEEEENTNMILLENHTKLCGSTAEIIPSLNSKNPNKVTVLTPDPKGFVEKYNNNSNNNATTEQDNYGDDGIAVVVGGPYWCETISIGHDKEVGIKLVLDKVGLTFEDCIYFGDGANDATGLASCGLGIAMKGAKPEAIASADRVSQWTNDEDAVAKELQIILVEEVQQQNIRPDDLIIRDKAALAKKLLNKEPIVEETSRNNNDNRDLLDDVKKNRLSSSCKILNA